MNALTDEEQAIDEVFSRFAHSEASPGSAERDRTGTYPAALVARLAELDGMGISVPKTDGGLGLTTKAQLIAIEHVASADAALASILTAHYLGVETLHLFADQAQRDTWLHRMATGGTLAAFGLTEPGAGSDIAGMRTRAEHGKDGWILNGSKTFISNAAEAGAIVLFATTDPAAGFHGITAFLVPAEAPGVNFSAPQDKMGLRSAPTYTVYLDDVHLPDTAIIGTTGQGGTIALTVLNAARIDIAAMANGIARNALHLATDYAATREQFGRPIKQFQAIQLQLGQMDAELEAARQTCWWAGGHRDAGDDLRRAGSIAKYIATETCHHVVDTALQIHGGSGYMTESEIERLYRDCRVLRIYEGTSHIQLLTIAHQL